MSGDSYALVHAAPREPYAPSVLDLCCGSGVQGIVALSEYADTAVFVDLNPRALRFTRFNLFFNGMQHRAKVFNGSLYDALPPSIGPFDAILVNPPFNFNPGGSSPAAFPMYSKGLNKGSPPLMFGSPPSWSVNVSSSGGSKL